MAHVSLPDMEEKVVEHSVPDDLELIRLLDEQIGGRLLHNIINHVNILDFHPADLYEEYREHNEAGCIYFLDYRDNYSTARRRPARATTDGAGRWKASHGGKAVMRRGGGVVGYKVTMVFYEKDEHPGKPDRMTDWALNEYTPNIVGPDNEVESLALYRLYKIMR